MVDWALKTNFLSLSLCLCKEVGKREIIYLSLHCHHQNNSCIEMGIDESHFNISFIVRDKVTRQCPQIATFLLRKESRSEHCSGLALFKSRVWLMDLRRVLSLVGWRRCLLA